MTVTKNYLNVMDVQQEFSNSENIDSTGRKVFNLAPLEELLTTGIQPHQLAHELDELIFDYVQTVFYLHARRQSDEDFIHTKTSHFIFYLRELRNALLECTENY